MALVAMYHPNKPTSNKAKVLRLSGTQESDCSRSDAPHVQRESEPENLCDELEAAQPENDEVPPAMLRPEEAKKRALLSHLPVKPLTFRGSG